MYILIYNEIWLPSVNYNDYINIQNNKYNNTHVRTFTTL